MVKFRFTCITTTADPLYMGYALVPNFAGGLLLFPGPSGGGGNSWGTLLNVCRTNPYCAAKLITGAGGSGSKATLKVTIPIGKATGNSVFRTDDDYTGGGTGGGAFSPLLIYSFFFFIATSTGNATGSNTATTVSAAAKLYCKLYATDLEGN